MYMMYSEEYAFVLPRDKTFQDFGLVSLQDLET